MAVSRGRRHLRELWVETDVVGVQDFVMLQHFDDVRAVYGNLRDRFNKRLIYVCVILSSLTAKTYIGNVLVAVNPYENLHIYSEEFLSLYRNVDMFELPPHM